MSKRIWIFAVLIFAIVGFWAAKNLTKKSPSEALVSAEKVSEDTYWTCPMHPQVHQDHPGECPICHMKLVKVTKKIEQKKEGEKRASVSAPKSQFMLLGAQKQEVETMDLRAVIPISGRIISRSQVAFQVYEKDLSYIRPGLSFRGAGNIHSEEEISGVVTIVDSIVDPTSRTVRVVGSIRKGPSGLLSETSFRGEIELALKDRVAIPESAVLHTGSGDLVYLVNNDNSLTAKRVKLGLKTEGFYEVREGLSHGDVISSGPNFLIDSEAKIRGAND
jgi:multidrug efflux pump subunit AcrA (membrane-fusion protein)